MGCTSTRATRASGYSLGHIGADCCDRGEQRRAVGDAEHDAADGRSYARSRREELDRDRIGKGQGRGVGQCRHRARPRAPARCRGARAGAPAASSSSMGPPLPARAAGAGGDRLGRAPRQRGGDGVGAGLGHAEVRHARAGLSAANASGASGARKAASGFPAPALSMIGRTVMSGCAARGRADDRRARDRIPARQAECRASIS